ncbi:MAG: aminopeptidase N, partial [Proteobacteria bacterium]
YVLARPETATAADFDAIEGVIGHEYFHNWSGNRVTCRDWFQLSLKEGFTVFRDQEFSADMGSRGVKRINDVNLLRAHQFPEDNGPMAHPVRPDSYVEINNFYTMTVYNKGAEVVRMLYNLLGPEQFRRGCDLYFARHDGDAVTTDDFVRAHEDASNRSFEQFRLWYEQSGTPRVAARLDYDAAARTCTVHLSQRCPPTPGQKTKQPFHIPVRGALFDRHGRPLPSRLDPETDAVHEHVFELTQSEQTFVLHDVDDDPVPSFLRGFSAPVRMDTGVDARELSVLMTHDDDPFNRWNAGQQFALSTVLRALPDVAAGRSANFDEAFLDAFEALLDAEIEDSAFHAFALRLPDFAIVAEEVETVDPRAIHDTLAALEKVLAVRLKDKMLDRYRRFVPEPPYRFDPAHAGRRALKNRLLHYLAAGDAEFAAELCHRQYDRADNMTDRMGALAAAVFFGLPGAESLLDRFHDDWSDQSLIVDKWLRLQASSPSMGSVSSIRSLMRHDSYKATNPNKVRALVGAFCHSNPARFHAADGAGYALLTEQVLALDPVNPQIAARLVSALNPWRRYAEPWRGLMQKSLQSIGGRAGLSRDTSEIVARALADGD